MTFTNEFSVFKHFFFFFGFHFHLSCDAIMENFYYIYAFQKIKHFFHLLKLKWGGMPVGGIQAYQRQVYAEVPEGVWTAVLSSLIVNSSDFKPSNPVWKESEKMHHG